MGTGSPPLHWLPTGEQMADLLTKKLRADQWWKVDRDGFLALPLKKCAEPAFKVPEVEPV